MFPEIRLSDSVILPTYLLVLSLLYCFLIIYAVHRAEKRDESVAVTLNLALILMVSGFIGARLTHVFYELPELYAGEWLQILRFWEGGFVFYGGFLLALLCSWGYLRWQKLSFAKWADFYAPVLALGYGLGRISCFLAGCCYGRFCIAPWAVRFPWDLQQVPRHPTQIYAVIWELCAFVLLISLEKRNKFSATPGRLFSFWLILHSIGRLIMESFRDDFRGSTILNLSLSTWISLLILAASLGAFVVLSKRSPRTNQ